jgi:hypothetical protein
LFVDAMIHGKTISNATVLPRSALRRGNQVFVVDEQDRLRFRTVNVLRLVDDQVYIGEGLRGGERVCVSALQSTTDGMLVRVVKDATAS